MRSKYGPITEEIRREIDELLSGVGILFRVFARGKDESSCLLYTSPSPRDGLLSRMPSSA